MTDSSGSYTKFSSSIINGHPMDAPPKSDDAITVPAKVVRTVRGLWPIFAGAGAVFGAVFTWGVMSANRAHEAADVRERLKAVEAKQIDDARDDRERDRVINRCDGALQRIEKQLDRLERNDRKDRAAGGPMPAAPSLHHLDEFVRRTEIPPPRLWSEIV